MENEHVHCEDENYDDPQVEARWCAERRAEVLEFLSAEKIRHGRVAEHPTWYVAPYVSLWEVESAKKAEALAGWAICGDLPTDYLSAKDVPHPRQALAAFAAQWRETAAGILSGEIETGEGEDSTEEREELAPLLNSLADILNEWAADDSLWEEDEDEE